MFAFFFLKQHHTVDTLGLQPSTIAHSSIALLLPTSYSSFYVLHLISSSSAFEFTELCLIDIRPYLQLIKVISNSNLHLPCFRSSFRLLSSRCSVSILSAPSHELCMETVLTEMEGRTSAEPPLNRLPFLTAVYRACCFEQFNSGFLFLPH